MSLVSEDKMIFKDFKSAVDFVHKEFYSNFPRYMVEQYVHFGDKYPNIMGKIMSGIPLDEEEQKIMDAGKEFKHNKYEDGEVIEDAVDVVCVGDASQELIDSLFKDEVKPEDSEKIKPDDVPDAVNNEKIKIIMEEQDKKDDNGLNNF